MYFLNHENRYFLDRMTHIAWVLAVLVLVQFHLIHISSFSFINCMSEQIVTSLEDISKNHTFKYKQYVNNEINEFDEQILINYERYLLDDHKDLSIGLLELNQKAFYKQSRNVCLNQEIDTLVDFQNLNVRFIKNPNLRNPYLERRYRGPQIEYFFNNHTYFKEFFEETTDIYFFRIVDQMAQINHDTLEILDEDKDSYKEQDGFYKEPIVYFNKPLPLSFPPVGKSELKKQNLSKNQHKSDILQKEMRWFHNMIVSDDSQDIIKTIEILNQTYTNSTQNFQRVSNLKSNQKGISKQLLKGLNIFQNFLSAQLMNDNFYAFSYDPELLNLSLEDLQSPEKQNLRLKYVQVDSMSKCVPQDWFLGYDQFAIYTWLNLNGFQEGESGFFRTMIRPQKTSLLNVINQLDQIQLEFSEVFSHMQSFSIEQPEFFNYSILKRVKILAETLIDLCMLQGLVYVVSHKFQQMVFEIFKDNQTNLNTTKLVWLLMIVFIIKQSKFVLRFYDQCPYSVMFIAYTAFFQYNFGFFLLRHSNYHLKYCFQMFLASFLNYFYLKSYPHCNVTLTNIIYIAFISYQLTHNLFKFSFQFELQSTQIGRGNLSVTLPANIQNRLQQNHLTYQFGLQNNRIQQQIQETLAQQQRQQEEQERQRRAAEQRLAEQLQREQYQRNINQAINRNQFQINQQQRLMNLETEFTRQARGDVRAQGFTDPAQQQRWVDQQVNSQMAQVREIVSSPQYENMLNQFDDIINGPIDPNRLGITGNQQPQNQRFQNPQPQNPQPQNQHAQQQNQGQQNPGQQINEYMQQFQTYSDEVNRQISNIADVLNQITTNANQFNQPPLANQRPSQSQNQDQTQNNETTQEELSDSISSLMMNSLNRRLQEANMMAADLQNTNEQLLRDFQQIPREASQLLQQAEARLPTPCIYRGDPMLTKPEILQKYGQRLLHEVFPQNSRLQNITIDLLCPEQIARLECGCNKCSKLFQASQRWIQAAQEREEDVSQLTILELQQQLKILQKQLATVVELIGVQFILDKQSNRNRKLKIRSSMLSQVYTERMRLIDDVNEICDVLSDSRVLYSSQAQQQPETSIEQIRTRDNDILQRVSRRGIDRQYLNLNFIYEEAENRELQSQRRTSFSLLSQPEGSLSEEQRRREKKEMMKKIYEEQDHLPVSQTFIFHMASNDQEKIDLTHVKEQICYEDQSLILTGDHQIADLRLCIQNPTYIVSMIDKNLPGTEQMELEKFIATEIQKIAEESIWADPRNYECESVDINQIINYVNLKVIANFYRSSNYSQKALKDIHIERLCMKPQSVILREMLQESQDQDQRPIGDNPRPQLKYGENKEIQTFFKYVKIQDQYRARDINSYRYGQPEPQPQREEEKKSSNPNQRRSQNNHSHHNSRKKKGH